MKHHFHINGFFDNKITEGSKTIIERCISGVEYYTEKERLIKIERWIKIHERDFNHFMFLMNLHKSLKSLYILDAYIVEKVKTDEVKLMALFSSKYHLLPDIASCEFQEMKPEEIDNILQKDNVTGINPYYEGNDLSYYNKD